MRSRIPSGIRWTGNRNMEELLDDPLAESLYGLFLKVKDSPRHIAIKPEKLINEVFYISSQMYEDSAPGSHLDIYAHEIEADLGWTYGAEVVMPMIYAAVKSQGRKPKRIDDMLQSVENSYNKNPYWKACNTINYEKRAAKRKNGATLAFMRNIKNISKVIGKNPVIIIDNVEQLNAILGNNAKISKE